MVIFPNFVVTDFLFQTKILFCVARTVGPKYLLQMDSKTINSDFEKC